MMVATCVGDWRAGLDGFGDIFTGKYKDVLWPVGGEEYRTFAIIILTLSKISASTLF